MQSKEVRNMNRKIYRFCLVMVIAAAVVSGIFYYRFIQEKERMPKEGTFVWQEMRGVECA